MISCKNFTSTTKLCDDWIARSFRHGSTTPTYVNSNSENILFYLVNKVNLSLVVFGVGEVRTEHHVPSRQQSVAIGLTTVTIRLLDYLE